MRPRQLSLYDWRPDLKREPEPGEYVEEHGAVIPHIMMPGHIGRKVVYILRDHRPGLELFELAPRADIEARG